MKNDLVCSTRDPHVANVQILRRADLSTTNETFEMFHKQRSLPRGVTSNGRIRLSISTVNCTYELSGITHVTPFRKYGKHSTGSSTYGPWVRTYSKLFSCKSVLTVCSYRAHSNKICMYGRVSRGSLPRVRRNGLPTYGQSNTTNARANMVIPGNDKVR